MLKVVGASWLQTKVTSLTLVAIIVVGIFTVFFGGMTRDTRDGNYAATAFWGENAGFRIEFWGQGNNPCDIPKGVARAYYKPDMSKNGWAVLEIETQPEYPDWVQAHAAGLLEGSLTWQIIYWHWQNTVEKACEGREDFCDAVREILETNNNIIKEKADAFENIDSFWHQVKLFYSQLGGMEVGWHYAVDRSRQDYDIIHEDFLWMNVVCDLKDFELKMNATIEADPKRIPLSMALLKLLPNTTLDFLLAHASSAFYSAMLRIQKHYSFSFHMTGQQNSELVPGRVLKFTSYPGAVHSQDDFYQISGEKFNHTATSKNITVAGCAIKNLNRKLWNSVDITNEVLMGPRVLAANRLSKNGEEWARHLEHNNSGTGNKQWLVLESSNKTLSLWVVEQMPGLIHAEDQTQTLNKLNYWVSYGVPYYQDIKILSTNYEELNKPATKNPVEKILKAGQKNVTDLDSLIKLLRSPDLTLIGRSDLSLSDIQNYTQYWEINYNQSQNTRSTTEMNYIITSDLDSVLNKSDLSEHSVDEDDILNSTKNHIHVGKYYGHSFRDIFKTITSLKKLNEELELIEKNSKNTNQQNDVLPHTDRQLHINKSIITESKVLSLREFSGIIDFKICIRDGLYAAAGPPYSKDNGPIFVEPFQWSKSPINYLPHIGQSDIWNFDVVKVEWVWDSI